MDSNKPIRCPNCGIITKDNLSFLTIGNTSYYCRLCKHWFRLKPFVKNTYYAARSRRTLDLLQKEDEQCEKRR